MYSNSLLRLPLYPDLSISEVKSISKIINKFVEKSKVLHIVKDFIWFKNIFEIFENTFFKGQNSYYIFRNKRRNIHLSYITNLNYISKSIFSRLQMPSKMENYDFIFDLWLK